MSVTTGFRLLTYWYYAPAGTYYFRVLIDGVQSNVVTLYIYDVTVNPTSKTFSYGGFTEFTVTTSIAVSQAATIQWYSDAAGTITKTAPASVTTSETGAGTITRIVKINSDINKVTVGTVGTHYFRVIINGVQSSVCNIVITDPPVK